MDIPTVEFTYMGISDIEEACELYASESLNSLNYLTNNYAPIKTEGNDVEIICLPQILYDDVNYENPPSACEYFTNVYNNMIKKHGKKFMDLVVTKNLYKVMINIRNVLNFLMNDVYKTNTIMVTFQNVSNKYNDQSLYSKLIYSAIIQNFIIKEQYSLYNVNTITIEKRRSNKNVNNAN